MLTLNEDVYVIVDQDGVVEYDYDGPMLAYETSMDWLKDCLNYMQGKNCKKQYRISKVNLMEIF